MLEITSETTQTKDQETKPEIYRALGVREYFQYDPSGDYLNPILPERIGLKPLPCREKLKEDYSLLQSSSFQVEVAVNCQLSTVNCQLNEREYV